MVVAEHHFVVDAVALQKLVGVMFSTHRTGNPQALQPYSGTPEYWPLTGSLGVWG